MGKMSSVPEMTALRQRLAETIAWCRLHASMADPRESLRTPALRPANLSLHSDRWDNFDYVWSTPEQNQAVVSALAETRADLLRARNAHTDLLPPDLAEGRLLVTIPEESDWCGLSEAASEGFIDALDIPAWDTWVCYVHEPMTPDPELAQRIQKACRAGRASRRDGMDWQPPASVSYLLCWIPPQLLTLVEWGIKVNPVECFLWAADCRRRGYYTELLQQLDTAGLL
jgi:hypothetical protein